MFRKYNHYESKLTQNLLIWFSYIISSSLIVLSGIEGSIINFIPFPLTIVVVYLVIQGKEHKRAAQFIKKYYPEQWDHVKAHAIGNHIKLSWISDNEENWNDERIIELKSSLKQLVIFQVLMIMHFFFYSTVVEWLLSKL